jgi:hypothetical protein
MKNILIILIFLSFLLTESLLGFDNTTITKNKKYRVTSFINSKGQDILAISPRIINNLSLIPMPNSGNFKINEKKYESYIYHRMDGNTYISNDLKNWDLCPETPDFNAFKHSAIKISNDLQALFVTKNLYLNEKEGSVFEIINFVGQKIVKGTFNGLYIDLSGLNDGFYVAIINNNIYKFIKTN